MAGSLPPQAAGSLPPPAQRGTAGSLSHQAAASLAHPAQRGTAGSLSRQAAKARLRRLLLVPVAALLVLTGCADGTHPGAAAVVGDTEISVERVDEVSRSVTAALGQPFSISATLTELINSEVVNVVAERRSVTLNEAETADAMTALLNGNPDALKKFEKDPVANGFLRAAARSTLGTIKLGGGRSLTDQSSQQAFQAGKQIVLDESKRIDIEVSPRFGKWSGDQIANLSGSLSVESDQTKKQREERQQPQQQPQG